MKEKSSVIIPKKNDYPDKLEQILCNVFQGISFNLLNRGTNLSSKKLPYIYENKTKQVNKLQDYIKQ